MKTSTRVIICLSIVIIVFFGALAVVMYKIAEASQSYNSTGGSNSDPLGETKPELGKNVTIEYSWMWGGLSGFEADLGNVFVVAQFTITNNGYNSFSTDPSNFYVLVNRITEEVKCSFEPRTYTSENWKNTTISNGEIFEGRLHFQVPESWLFLEFGNINDEEFNIIWYE